MSRTQKDKNSKDPPLVNHHGPEKDTQDWYVDSRAIFHNCRDISLHNAKQTKTERVKSVRVGDGGKIEARYSEDVRLVLFTDFGKVNVYLRDVLCMPQAGANMLSAAQEENNYYVVSLKDNGLHVYQVETESVALKKSAVGKDTMCEHERVRCISPTAPLPLLKPLAATTISCFTSVLDNRNALPLTRE